MRHVNVKDARDNLKALLDEVEAGEEIVLLRRGRPVAHLVPPPAEPRRLPSLAEFRQSIRVQGTPLSEEIVRARQEERF